MRSESQNPRSTFLLPQEAAISSALHRRRRQRLASSLRRWSSSSRAAWPLQPASAPDNGGREIVDRTLVSSSLHHVTNRGVRIPAHVATAAPAVTRGRSRAPPTETHRLISSFASSRFAKPSSAVLLASGAPTIESLISFTALSKSPCAL